MLNIEESVAVTENMVDSYNFNSVWYHLNGSQDLEKIEFRDEFKKRLWGCLPKLFEDYEKAIEETKNQSNSIKKDEKETLNPPIENNISSSSSSSSVDPKNSSQSSLSSTDKQPIQKKSNEKKNKEKNNLKKTKNNTKNEKKKDKEKEKEKKKKNKKSKNKKK